LSGIYLDKKFLLSSLQLDTVKILQINDLTPQKILEVVALDQYCFGGLWTADGYLREINSPNSSLLVLSLGDINRDNNNTEQKTDDFKIIGIACLWAIVEEAHITLLGVHPNYRRQGLGQMLLYTLLQDARERKLRWATLEVEVNNSSAIALYEKFGFKIVGKRKGYYQKTGEDALILWHKGIDRPEFQADLANWTKKINARLSNRYHLSLSSLQSQLPT
jgi:[ribosomal protein S18]-alanine N-acetyltransferase